jgi:hypothetical protein
MCRLLVGMLVFCAVQSGAQLHIHRVLPDPMGNESRNDTPEIIEVRNYGTEAIQLEGWSLQSTPPEEPDVWTFPVLMLEPGVTVSVHWKMPVPEQIITIFPPPLFTGGGVSLLNNDGADVALVDPEGEIQHYVQWASSGQGLESPSADAGKWTLGEVVTRPEEGHALVYDGDGFRASDWRIESFYAPTAIEPVIWSNVKRR